MLWPELHTRRSFVRCESSPPEVQHRNCIQSTKSLRVNLTEEFDYVELFFSYICISYILNISLKEQNMATRSRFEYKTHHSHDFTAGKF